jgi:DNA polymerase-3 subunit gamma/tau
LEEPPPSVKFILATTEPQRLPETILSRCQRYDFRRIALREIVERLGAIAKEEGLKITDGALVLLAREADGSMRDAQSFLEQVLASAGSEAPVDEALLQELLGISERRALYDLSAAVIAGDAARCLELLAALSAQGRDLGRLSRDLLEHFRNLLVARLTEKKPRFDGAELLDLPDQEIADLKAQVKNVSVEMLMDYFDVMAAGDDEVARAAVPRFALEAVLIRLAILPDALPVRELLERLEELEKRLAGRPGAKELSAKGSPAQIAPQSAPKSGVAPARPAPTAGNEQVWRDLVATVRREKKFLASHLDQARPIEMVPGRLSIAVGERHELSFLQDAENFTALKNIATAFFRAETAIDVQLLPDREEAREKSRAQDATTAALSGRSALVNEAVRIFGGTVRSVRRDGGEG